MKIEVKKDDEGYFFDLEQFKDIIDINLIVYYTVEQDENSRSIVVIFYDKDQNIIKPKASV